MRATRSSGRLTMLLAAVVLAAGGCGSDPTSPGQTGVTQGDADDVALQTTTTLQIVGGDLEAMLGSQPLTISASPRVRPARVQFDTTYVWNGLTYEATRTYYDADEIALPGYGPTATRVHWTSRTYGDVMGQRDTATVGRTAVLDLRGIESTQDTLQLDGTTQDTLFIRFRSLDNTQMRYFYWTSGLTIDRVRILKSSLLVGFRPLSGTITLLVSADRLRSYDRADVAAHVDATVVITFDGTGQADLVVSGRYRFHWDLDTGVVTRA